MERHALLRPGRRSSSEESTCCTTRRHSPDPDQGHGPENRTLDRRPSREGRAEGRRRKAADRPFLVPLSGRRSARKRGEEYFPCDRGRRRRRELRHPARHVRRAGTSGAKTRPSKTSVFYTQIPPTGRTIRTLRPTGGRNRNGPVVRHERIRLPLSKGRLPVRIARYRAGFGRKREPHRLVATARTERTSAKGNGTE